MTNPPLPVPEILPPPRPRGRLGQWSDRVKALLLLSLLAVTGALAGLGTPGAEAERVRDGLSTGGTLRAALAEVPAALVQADREQACPDLAGGDPPPGKALPPQTPGASLALPVVVAWADVADPVPFARAGHAARMPTGPPARLSV